MIVLVNLGLAWLPKWHYAVVIGYDQKKQDIILHSGLNKSEVLSFWTFTNIWKRGHYWGLLVLPPNQMPESVEEGRWLESVAGLENTQQWQAAAVGYAAATERWHDSFIAWMGLGHSQYQLQDFKAAGEAFQQASSIQPRNGMAWNNLAHVLAQQGKFDAALDAAQRAVDLGGPLQETYQQTFADIQQSQSSLGPQD
ncbi:MAG: PA2778 family cysteine peptidase [Desulfuromonadales bacterium]